MKQILNIKTIVLVFAGLIVFSCAKERSPSLHITVLDEKGAPASGATVHAWPSNDATSAGSTVNEAEMDKTGTTDVAGYIKFDFKFSAVLDVDVVYYRTNQTVDTSGTLITTIDSLSGHKVVKIETVRQTDEANDYRETVNLR